MDQNNQPENSLYIHEWMVIMTISSFILFIVYISAIRSSGTLISDVSDPDDYNWIEVYIGGEVAQPGPYKIRRHTQQTDAAQLAKPLPTADLERMKKTRPLSQGDIIRVPKYKKPSKKRVKKSSPQTYSEGINEGMDGKKTKNVSFVLQKNKTLC